jgi:hypothetical protein
MRGQHADVDTTPIVDGYAPSPTVRAKVFGETYPHTSSCFDVASAAEVVTLYNAGEYRAEG